MLAVVENQRIDDGLQGDIVAVGNGEFVDKDVFGVESRVVSQNDFENAVVFLARAFQGIDFLFFGDNHNARLRFHFFDKLEISRLREQFQCAERNLRVVFVLRAE